MVTMIRNILNGSNLYEDLYGDITPGEITKFKYAKITSCDL